jgi:hypothetical protein
VVKKGLGLGRKTEGKSTLGRPRHRFWASVENDVKEMG